MRKLPWTFPPADAGTCDVHPGELTQVRYEVDEHHAIAPLTGQAMPSYGPQLAGAYFKKLECFCFTAAVARRRSETRQMPVVFVVDPALPRDVNDDHAVVHVLRGRGQQES